MGYPADGLNITQGVTPLLTLKSTLALLATYYAVIFTGRELMRNRPAFKLNDLFLIHNLYLTVISGILLMLFVEQVAPTVWKHGLFFTICDAGGWTRPLVTLYYVSKPPYLASMILATDILQLNYLTKYLELLDTVFLVLKKKPLTARGIRIWWKEWITRLQISQFILDLGFVYYAAYNYAASTYFPRLPHVGTCGGEELAAFTGCAILSSYLVLFISFYAATYKKASIDQKRSVSSLVSDIPRTAAVDLKDTQVPQMVEPSEAAIEALHKTEDLIKAASTHLQDLSFPGGTHQ
ncbi:MAG: hypothetical protein Q9163_002725 [Psora crenata]